MYQNRNVILCSFYSFNLFASAMRFKEQANRMIWQDNTPIFDSIEIYNEYTLPHDTKFDEILRPKVHQGHGFGHWCWKPFVIAKTLEKCQEGDIVVYLDIGCTLSPQGIQKMQEYFDLAIKNTFVCGEMQVEIEKVWTKADLLQYFGVLHDTTITDTKQRPATLSIYCKNNQSVQFVTQWLQVFYDDYSLVDDSSSKIPNLEGFRDHRHDQSAFSILSKLYKVQPLDFVVEFHNKSPLYPITASRDKMFSYNILREKNKYFNALFRFIKTLMPSRKYRIKFMDSLHANLTNYIVSNLNSTKFQFVHKDIFIDCCTFILMNIAKKDIHQYIQANHDLLLQELHQAR